MRVMRAYSPVAVKPIVRTKGIIDRALYHGGQFAPPGHSEIVHTTSIAARDLMLINNAQRPSNQYQWAISTNTMTPPPFGVNALTIATYRNNNSQWGISVRRGPNVWEFDFIPLDLPSTMLPIYINPNHYVPTEITITGYGIRSNNAQKMALIYFYRLDSSSTDEFFFHNRTIARIVTVGIQRNNILGVIPQRKFFGTQVVPDSFTALTLANGSGEIQSSYFGSYAPNNDTVDQAVGFNGHTFSFPLRSNLLNSAGTAFHPDVRIAIVPLVTVHFGSNFIEHYPTVAVRVKCKANQ